MKVREYIKIKDWSEFVEAHPNGNIFQTPEIYDVYRKTNNLDPILLVVYENNEILGILLAVIQSEYSGVVGKVSKRSIIRGGPLVKDNNEEVLDIILKSYSKKIKYKAIYSQFRNHWDWGSLKNIFIKNNFLYEEHLDILFDLTKGEDKLWSEIKRVRKKGIKQSYKKGVIIREIDLSNKDLLGKSHQILSSVYQRVKLPLPSIDFFENNINFLSDKLFTLGLFIEGDLAAVRLVFCFNDKIYDWYAGAKDEYLSYRPNDVLPWEIIKWGVNNNQKVFSFGGAGKPDEPYGVRDYKLKFGGELVEFGRFEKVHKPILMNVARLGLSIWQNIKF